MKLESRKKIIEVLVVLRGTITQAMPSEFVLLPEEGKKVIPVICELVREEYESNARLWYPEIGNIMSVQVTHIRTLPVGELV